MQPKFMLELNNTQWHS